MDLPPKRPIEIFKDTDIRFIIMGTNRQDFSENLLQTLKSKGVPVKFCYEIEYDYPGLMKDAFRKISEGVKVCMDICMTATEEDIIPEEKEVIAVAGTSPIEFENGEGADTALVMIPRKSEGFNKPREKSKRRDIKEIICKPR